jgi:hypothetical protein
VPSERCSIEEQSIEYYGWACCVYLRGAQCVWCVCAHTHDDVKHEVQKWLRGQDPTFYRQGFEKWISRLEKCINREGDYVEK